jgi:hypothetical protein
MNLELLDLNVIVPAAVLIWMEAVLVWLSMRNRRRTTAGLRQKFGSEHDRTAPARDAESKAESRLVDRARRDEMRKIYDLEAMERKRYLKQWEAVQSHYVDFPKGCSRGS